MKRISSTILAICVVFSLFSHIVSASSSERASYNEEIIVDVAGETDSNNQIVPMSAGTPLDISSGVYYINNKCLGSYLTLSGSSFTYITGYTSTFSSSTKWYVQESDTEGQYVLRSYADDTKFIGVSAATSTSASIITVSGLVPDTCRWQILSADGGGCLLKNVYSSKYLYTIGGGLFVKDTPGTAGTMTYYTSVWRLATPTTLQNKELTSFSVDTMTMWPGDAFSPSINATPTSAYWVAATDFSFTGYDSAYVTYNANTGVFTAQATVTSLYSAVITASHRVTGATATFTLVVKPNAILVGIPDTENEHDHVTALTDVAGFISSWGYTSTVYGGSYTVSQISDFINNDVNSVFISRSHGTRIVSASSLTTVLGTCILPVDGDNSVYYSSIYMTSYYSSNELSNMDLIMFIGCETGYGGDGAANLPTVAVDKGATAAIGFEGNIWCDSANEWLVKFIAMLEAGKTVYSACAELAIDYTGTGLENYVISGYEYATFND